MVLPETLLSAYVKLPGYSLHEEHLSWHLEKEENRLALLPTKSKTVTNPARCGYKIIPLPGILALWVVEEE